MSARLALAQLLAGHAYAVVPVEPTSLMLEAGCPDGHRANKPMSAGGTKECPLISKRRIVWADMLRKAPLA